jgi:hypothetical protein
VNIEKQMVLMWETYMLRKVATLLPAKLPTRRELLIQCGKLERIIFKPIGPTAFQLLGGASVKKYKKALAKQSLRIGQQHKKVKGLSEKFFKEFLREDNPSLTNAEYRTWRAKFDEGMQESIGKLSAKATGRAIDKMLGPKSE